MKYFLTCLLLMTAPPLFAADWALRAKDHILSHEEVEALTLGQTLTFYDDGKSKYSAGGAYSYTYASGESAFGSYRIADDGTVCVTYRNGVGRCDRYVQNGDRIVLLTQNGLRFPIRGIE